MRKLRIAACLALILALIPTLALVRTKLPRDNRALVEKKYAGWCGVLRLWVFEGWEGGGSAIAWLNPCIERFERRHPGVYVQPQPVDAGAIASFNASGILPPDMLLFPPGMLESPSGLLPLEIDADLRPSLSRCGVWRGWTFAVPVLMGGYLWVFNAGLIDGVPDTWRGGDAPAVPPDGDWHCSSAALLALCARRCAARRDDMKGSNPGATAELDLGLAGAADAPTPAPTLGPDDATLPCELPANFDFDADAWRDFINGNAPALLATPREVRRLQALSESGRAPDWRAGRVAPFTDLLLSLALVDRPDAEAQRALCVEFVEHLLSDSCQGGLSRIGAFSVTGAPSGYGAGEALAEMDAALRAMTLSAPPVWGNAWRDAAARIVRKYIAGAAEAAQLWASFNTDFLENPNIQLTQGR